MTQLPNTEKSLLIRTDFSNDETWNRLCEKLNDVPEDMEDFIDEEMGPILEIIDDKAFEGKSSEELMALLNKNYSSPVLFIVDSKAIEHNESPVLIIDLDEEKGRNFRAAPGQIFAIESNLSIANMGWEDFAESSDSDGIFRGFPEI